MPEFTEIPQVIMHRTELVMPKDIYDQMRSIAKRRGQTVSDAIREAVRDWIEAKA